MIWGKFKCKWNVIYVKAFHSKVYSITRTCTANENMLKIITFLLMQLSVANLALDCVNPGNVFLCIWKNIVSKIFQKRYIELPILELFLIGAPIKITYFSQVFLIRGVSYRPPCIWFIFLKFRNGLEKTCSNYKEVVDNQAHLKDVLNQMCQKLLRYES